MCGKTLPGSCAPSTRLPRGSRQGMALPLVLMCVALIIVFAAALTRAVMVQHRQLVVTEQQQQAFWLAESALQRAASRLRESEAYDGEQWLIPADQLPGDGAGRVHIRVTPLPDGAAGWVVSAEALYPDVPQHRACVYREQTLRGRDTGQAGPAEQAENNG